MKNNNKVLKFLYKLFVFFPTILISNIVYAQTSTSNTDVSTDIIAKIFGGLLGNSNVASESDPFANTISAFNGAVLTVGGLLAAYTIVAGIINTAHDGTMLGRKFSATWLPIRTALATALVLPLPMGAATGYCLMQVVAMWIITQGIGLANTTWSAFIGDFGTKNSIFSISVKNPKVETLATEIFKSLVCTNALNIEAEKNQELLQNYNFHAKSFGFTTQEYGSARLIKFGASDNSPASRSGADRICGKITINNVNINNASQQTNIGSWKGAVSSINSDDYKTPPPVEIAESHYQATMNMINELNNVAANFVLDPSVYGSNSTAIDDAVRNYNNYVRNNAASWASRSEPTQSIINNATKDGWFLAGAWYMRFVSVANKINIATGDIPEATPTSTNANTFSGLFMFNPSIVTERINNAKIFVGKTSAGLKSGLSSEVTATEKEEGSVWNPASKLLAEVVATLTSIDMNQLSTTTIHPVMLMKNMGDNLIEATLAAITLGTGVAFASGGTLTAGLSAVVFVTPILFTLFAGLLTLGFTLSYYIPMLPFFIWLGALVGWVILVVEAIFAAPLWAVIHLHPSGEDVGKGASGYMLILGLTLRPTFMILGLIAALVIVQVVGDLLNKIFLDVFSISQTGNMSLLFGVIFAHALYVGMMLTFIKKTFELVHIIPDQLMRWIGGGSDHLGQYAGQMTQGAQMVAAGVAAGVTSGAQTSVTGAMNSIQNMRQLKQQKSHADLQRSQGNQQYDSIYGVGASAAKESHLKAATGLSDVSDMSNYKVAQGAQSFDGGAQECNAIAGSTGVRQYMVEMDKIRDEKAKNNESYDIASAAKQAVQAVSAKHYGAQGNALRNHIASQYSNEAGQNASKHYFDKKQSEFVDNFTKSGMGTKKQAEATFQNLANLAWSDVTGDPDPKTNINATPQKGPEAAADAINNQVENFFTSGGKSIANLAGAATPNSQGNDNIPPPPTTPELSEDPEANLNLNTANHESPPQKNPGSGINAQDLVTGPDKKNPQQLDLPFDDPPKKGPTQLDLPFDDKK